MGFKFVQKLPDPSEIREQYPLPLELAEIKKKRDAEIKKVFTGESDKFLLIIGPCSADNEDAVCDYTSRLVKVQERVAEKVIIIPRVYTNKAPSRSRLDLFLRNREPGKILYGMRKAQTCRSAPLPL